VGVEAFLGAEERPAQQVPPVVVADEPQVAVFVDLDAEPDGLGPLVDRPDRGQVDVAVFGA
jgi:hypothetical protein